MSLEHQELVSVIRSVHQNLRNASINADRVDKVWADHLADATTRKKYSAAMLKLATEVWREKGESRIKWSYETCINYFFGSGLKRCLLRDARIEKVKSIRKFNLSYDLINEDLLTEPNNYEGLDRKLEVLDVGSCYNPFSKFAEFSCTAIDLTPATNDVLECDFLSVKILPKPENKDNDEKSVKVFYEESFDVVIFSLVLEYLPVAKQRAIFCYNAWKLLQENGLCIIITPDSKSVNSNAKLMKKWKLGLDLIGLQRVYYEKLEHLHCMAFRKISKCHRPECLEILPNYLPIPQDKSRKKISSESNKFDRSEEENKEISICFLQLPDLGDL